MPKSKRNPKAKPRKEKRDFAQTAFSVFQKASGVKGKSAYLGLGAFPKRLAILLWDLITLVLPKAGRIDRQGV